MGGELPQRPAGSGAPAFAVWALRDAGVRGHPGTPLQRIQVVKLYTEGGRAVQHVYDIAGEANDTADVDLASCTPHDSGADQLCSVWRDPEFDATQHAVYYVRVVENPSCRWQTFLCNSKGVDCTDPGSIGPGLEACCDPEIPKTIQERAWTSPIWYSPSQ